MTNYVAEPWLSASINAPAAWAAFAAVQQLPWSLKVSSWSPLKLEVDHGHDFQACLDAAGAFGFDKRARGEIALRILTIVDDLDERKLRLRHIPPDIIRGCSDAQQRALTALKATIFSRIRDDLHRQFDSRPETWAARVKTALTALPHAEARATAIYMGVDQELPERACITGLSYAFTTLEPRLVRTTQGLILGGQARKLREVRAARHHPEPKARARNLALRALEARLAAIRADSDFDDILFDLSSDDVLLMLREELRETVKRQGSWGLIDATIRRDRLAEGLALPEVLAPEIWDLVRQQEARIDLLQL